MPGWRERFAVRAFQAISGMGVSAERKQSLAMQAILQLGPYQAKWMQSDYETYAREGYAGNPYVYAGIRQIAMTVAGIPWKVYKDASKKKPYDEHPLLSLIRRPNPAQAGGRFFENLVGYLFLDGNVYIERAGGPASAPTGSAASRRPDELYCLRPDRVRVLFGTPTEPIGGYIYRVGGAEVQYPADRILHERFFHPTNDFYGLSPLAAAAKSVDQSNASKAWNVSMLQHGAAPMGALTAPTRVEDTQYRRLQEWLEEQYGGWTNAGRPMILENQMSWAQIGFNPVDMAWEGGQKLSAREIAMVLSIAPELIGDPESKTFSNYQEARVALYEECALPFMDWLRDDLNAWLGPAYDGAYLDYDRDAIEALQENRDAIYTRNNAAFTSGWLRLGEAQKQAGVDVDALYGKYYRWQLPQTAPADPEAALEAQLSQQLVQLSDGSWGLATGVQKLPGGPAATGPGGPGTGEEAGGATGASGATGATGAGGAGNGAGPGASGGATGPAVSAAGAAPSGASGAAGAQPSAPASGAKSARGPSARSNKARRMTTNEVKAHLTDVEALREAHIGRWRTAVRDLMTPLEHLAAHPQQLQAHLLKSRAEWVETLTRLYETVGTSFADHAVAALAARADAPDAGPSSPTYARGLAQALQSYIDANVPARADRIVASLAVALPARLSNPNPAAKTRRARKASPTAQPDAPDASADDTWSDDDMTALLDDAADTVAESEVVTASNLGPLAGASAFAAASGASLVKTWQALLDTRTRDDHRDADGQTVLMDDPFDIGGDQLLFPLDESLGAGPDETRNCRCVVTFDIAETGGSEMTRAQRATAWAHETVRAATPVPAVPAPTAVLTLPILGAMDGDLHTLTGDGRANGNASASANGNGGTP